MLSVFLFWLEQKILYFWQIFTETINQVQQHFVYSNLMLYMLDTIKHSNVF